MKLGTVFLGAAGLMSLGLASAVNVSGCSSSTTVTTTTDGGTGATGATGPTGATGATGADGGTDGGGTDSGLPSKVPPAQPTGPTTTATAPHNFALHHIHVGDESDSSGSPDWYKYGYDLDGKDTTASSKDVCTLYANANAKNQTDAPGGVDNSFGENIIPLLSAVLSNPSATINTSLNKGSFTVMMDITGLDFTKPNQTAIGLSGALYGGTVFGQGPNAAGSAPTWTTADNWPLDKTSITSAVGTDANQTLVQPVKAKNNFTGAYITNGVFVSGSATSVTLTLTISGTPLVIPIQHAFITFNAPGTSEDGGVSAGHVSGGIISGVIDAAQLVANLQGVAGNISTSFCSGGTFDTIKKAILQASDIMDDGTNVAGTACNGISIGVGFDGDEIGQPFIAGDPPAATNPCGSSDAGTDSGTDSGPVDAGAGDQ